MITFSITEAEKEEGFKIWKFTDDTAMARSVARSLTENKSFDAADMAERYNVLGIHMES